MLTSLSFGQIRFEVKGDSYLDGKLGVGVKVPVSPVEISTSHLTALSISGENAAGVSIDINGNASNVIPGIRYLQKGVFQASHFLDDEEWVLALTTGEVLRVTPAGHMGIGTTSPIYPLHIEPASSDSSGLLVKHQPNNDVEFVNAIVAELRDFGTGGFGTAIRALAVDYNAHPFDNARGVSSAGYGPIAVGLVGSGFHTEDNGQAFGVKGFAHFSGGFGPSSVRYGVWGYGEPEDEGTEYGVYASGDLAYTGNLIGPPSDLKLKKDIRNLRNGLEVIDQLRPVTFEMRLEEFPQMCFSEGRQFGFVAQEVEEVLPELVSDNVHPALVPDESSDKTAHPAVEYKGINYISLIPVLTQAIQEQQKIIEGQEERIDRLERELDELKAMVLERGNVRSDHRRVVDLDQARLDQNVPNPFSGETIIGYYLPETSGQAVLRLSSSDGKLVKEIPILERGEGRLVLRANSLSRGGYWYSLMIDGSVVDSRMMLLQ